MNDIIEAVEKEEKKRVETIRAFTGEKNLGIEEQPNQSHRSGSKFGDDSNIEEQPNQSHRSSFEFGEDANIKNIENIVNLPEQEGDIPGLTGANQYAKQEIEVIQHNFRTRSAPVLLFDPSPRLVKSFPIEITSSDISSYYSLSAESVRRMTR